ncbi:glycosyltransferase family 2 protein [Geodermatophilus sp. SYSU D00684]
MTRVPDGPLVTVAMPTFRRPDLLRQAIESVLAQTYRNLEVLVSDSAADPEIETLVAGYGDPRLRYRHNGRVTDMSTNALAMYTAARGEFIGTLHDDDLWEPEFLEVLVPPLVDDPSVVVSFCDYWVMDSEGEIRPDLTEAAARLRGRTGLRPGRHQPFTDLATTSRAVFLPVAGVFRASAMDWSEWRHEAAAGYDMWLAYLLARDGAAAWYDPRRLSRYRHHPAAASSTARLDAAAVWCFERFLADDRLSTLRPDLVRAAAPHHAGLALTALHSDEPGARAVAARHLNAASRAGVTAGLLFGGLLWPLPHPVRRRVIDLVRRSRSRRRARVSPS